MTTLISAMQDRPVCKAARDLSKESFFLVGGLGRGLGAERFFAQPKLTTARGAKSTHLFGRSSKTVHFAADPKIPIFERKFKQVVRP